MYSNELNKLKEAIKKAKASKKSLTKNSGETLIANSYRNLENAKKSYITKKSQLKKQAALYYETKKKKNTKNTNGKNY